MSRFDVADQIRQRDETDDRYREFLTEPSMSVGVYRLPAGSVDEQEPHDEDEMYYVLSGRATIAIGDDSHPVEAGDVVFVERGVDHGFLDIEEDLETLVVFAPGRDPTTD